MVLILIQLQELELAQGYDYANNLITCECDNIASEKTIVANGGKFEKEIHVDDKLYKRYWIQL